MCTLLLAPGVWDARLIVAANRDERLDRPASGPHAWPGEPLPFFAPRDDVAGGSWIGANRAGLFVGITNRSIGGGPSVISPDRRSRGALVLDALRSRSVDEAIRSARAHGPEAHNPFHLALVDADDARVLGCDGWSFFEEELTPGAVHIVTERSYGAAGSGRDALLREQLAAFGSDEPSLEDWRSLLSARRERSGDAPIAEAFDDVCVSVPAFGYGTRSSTWVRLGADGELRWATIEGPPSSAPFEEVSASIPWGDRS